MQRLFLIRHAKSDWANNEVADIDRPLNERGYRDAYFMSRSLKTAGIVPDLIISSPAIRAASTAFIFSRTFQCDAAKISFQKSLYDSSVKDYFRVIEATAGEHKTVFLIGHNPIITDTCNALSKTFIENFPTCAVAGIQIDSGDFKKTLSSKGELIHYDFPKNNS